jgi:hypothetical protein
MAQPPAPKFVSSIDDAVARPEHSTVYRNAGWNDGLHGSKNRMRWRKVIPEGCRICEWFSLML